MTDRSTSPRIERVAPSRPDALRLLRLSDELMAELYPAEANHMASVADLQDPDAAFFGCYVGDVLAGCGAAKVMTDDGRYGEIKRLYVDEAHRGRGLSTLLMQRLERHLAALGLDIVRLETGSRQPASIGLYRKLGYERRGPFGIYEENGWSVFFEKRLA